MFRLLYKTIKLMIKLGLIILLIVLATGIYTVKTTEADIAASYTGNTQSITSEAIVQMKQINPECIMVLGASVNPDGTPCQMLEDRLQTGIELYFMGIAPKLLLTGDNGQVEYNEVAVMRNYAIEAGVPEEDIFLDYAGFSTYDSVYRAGYVFGVKSMVVVTQDYHLYRSLYGCEKMGITAKGVGADQDIYSGQEMREGREILARSKDFFKWILKPDPKYLGERIPISGDGRCTQ